MLPGEEQGHAPRPGVGPDDRADGVDDDLLRAVPGLDLIRHVLGVLLAVAVADEHGLGRRVVRQLPHLVHQGVEGRLAAPGGVHLDEVPLVVHVHHGLDLEHGAHHGGGGGHPPALLQKEQVVDGEPVALAQLVFLRPVPDLLNGLALPAELGGLVHQHPLAQGGAQGVHHVNFALGVLLAQLLGGNLERAAGAGQAGGKASTSASFPC